MIIIKLGISHGCYSYCGSFENQIQKIKEHGYDCIDYQKFVATDGNPLFEKMDFSEFAAAMKADRDIVDSYGITVSQTHAPWRCPPQESTEAEQKMRLMQMCRAVEGTAILGCKNFVLHPFMPYTIHNIGKEKETLEINLWLIREICNVAQTVGVTVCLENMPMPFFSIAMVRQVLDCINAVGADNLKVCLDTGHVTMFGISPADAVRMIGKEKLAVLHVHDNDGKEDKHIRPFEGVIDWQDFCKALAEIDFDGTFSLECGAAKVPDELLEGELITLKNRGQYLVDLIHKLKGYDH